MGDYVKESCMDELLGKISAHEEDIDSRRRGADPEAQRIWDTKCNVLGRGLIVGRSGISHAGFGLYATESYPAGMLITEYTGVEIDKDEAMELRAAGKDQYIRSLKNGWCIDGNRFPALGEVRDIQFLNLTFNSNLGGHCILKQSLTLYFVI